jgi:DNA-binding PadR family transcriptional regulator
VFYILIALAQGERHGYEIMKTVRHDSGGAVKMGNGTLYGSLKRMLADSLIESAGDLLKEGDDTRRRYYRLTPQGRLVMEAEIKRYRTTITAIESYSL